MPTSPRSRRLGALVLLAAALSFAAIEADARPGRGGGGFGSRGARTFDAPAATTTAPRTAAPIERSATPQTQAPRPGVAQPGVPGRGAMAPGGLFSRGGGFFGGLLGAGLFGMLLGYGLGGGLGGLGSMLGLLLQLGLVAMLVMLAVRFFQRRAQQQQPAVAGAGAPLNRGMGASPTAATPRPYGGSAAGARPKAPRDDLGLGLADQTEFERLLGVVQTAYGKRDIAGLREVVTPEMAAYFEQELAQDAARGVVNHVSDPRLLQGDLAEGWREGATEYATVAMRFSLLDWTTEEATGRVVEGDPERPVEATEVWTFKRPRGGIWELSAVQQA